MCFHKIAEQVPPALSTCLPGRGINGDVTGIDSQPDMIAGAPEHSGSAEGREVLFWENGTRVLKTKLEMVGLKRDEGGAGRAKKRDLGG